MPSIRIIATPPGQAPERVRQGWIGLEIPLSENQPPNNAVLHGVVDKKQTSENAGGFAVDGKTAIDLLRVHNPEAAQWWQNNAAWIAGGGNQLVFAKNICQKI